MTKDASDMQHANSKKVCDHLEFLGYELEMRDEKDNYDTYLAKSDAKANLYVRSNQTVVYVRSMWTGFDARALKSKDFYSKLNQLNSDAVLVKSYYEGDAENGVSIITSALYYGYDKTSFGTFVDTFQEETFRFVQGLKDFTE